jgi:hypothetical protein
VKIVETLYLLLDEELTNGRFPRDLGKDNWGEYSAEDQAFWFQFYSLFYDRVYVPVNHLTDTDRALEFLNLLRISQDDSVLRMPGPIGPTILWDSSRFPAKTVTGIVRGYCRAKSDASRRTTKIALSVADLCDRFLPPERIEYRNMRAHLDARESIAQLRGDVFNPDENLALGNTVIRKMRDLVDKIDERGEKLDLTRQIGYGRDFFYSIFGFARTREDRIRMKQFSDITADFMEFRPHFLTAVDYVSHRLKAKFAGDALAKSIGVLMPPEYGLIMEPKNSRINLARNSLQVRPKSLTISERYPCYIDRRALINMNAQQLQTLHNSTEFKLLQRSFVELQDEMSDLEKLEANAAVRLGDYLERVGKTLNGKAYVAKKAVSIAIELIPNALGFLRVGLSSFGFPAPSGDAIIEIDAQPAARKAATAVVKKIARNPAFKESTIRLSEDMIIYLG